MSDLLSNATKDGGSVECLGLTFPSDDARREHFLNLLAEKLRDPAFRAQEGFPVGTDEAILAMSDPPYYTACPNPWLAEFVRHYGHPYDPAEKYAREPMAIDVSEGKTDPLYRAHSYHTKVPHLAIVPSILHYTEPGDIVLDGFAGSGMTGVAAQWCGTAPATYRHKLEMEWKKAGTPAPKWGARRVVLNDLSPAATFISANNNLPFLADAYEESGKRLLAELWTSIRWMYETLHSDGKTLGRIEYTVWSEAFICPSCNGENVFLDAEKVSYEGQRDRIRCSSCGAEARKEEMALAQVQFLEDGQVQWRPKRVAVSIFYKIGSKVFEKKPDQIDLEVLKRIDELEIPENFPHVAFRSSKTFNEGRMRTTNTRNTRSIFLPRAAHAIAKIWALAEGEHDKKLRMNLLYSIEQAIISMSVFNRYRPTGYSQFGQHLTGVFYVGSQHAECTPWYILEGKFGRVEKAFQTFRTKFGNAIVSTGSSTALPCPDGTIDYVFVDPPFGFNIFYADLNNIVEAWHRVISEVGGEAVIDDYAGKDIHVYQRLIRGCFLEFFRVLKPGRWMTVVFSNSQAKVWNAIQVALQEAGFVVAEVTTLDKKQGSFKQVTSTNAVKQDLIISAYKPNGGLEQRLAERGAAPESAWDFVQTHLRQLSVSKSKDGVLEFVVERDPRRIYDRMIAWFVRHDVPVPLSTEEFLDGLRSRFSERDGMVFLPDQIPEYERKRAQAAQPPQMEMFVADERSAIDWLTDFLRKRPSTYQEVHPEFTTQLGAGWKKHETRPELSALLEDNFLRYDASGEVPSQIHNYLSTNFHDLRNLEKSDPRLRAKAKDRWFVPDPNKAQDLETKREKALLKEFDEYRTAPGRRLKEFRLEVLRAGFKSSWAARDFKTIIAIAQKVPEEALQEDEKLLFWYDSALTRMEANA
ncbi:DNA methyltransferase [Novosphingobium resinovorum]|uniref:site-specific DNA-methyltransferase (adenine-specific) n=1 Tax=Novosphingobium resinovorum TaxID=158500 RepID=A0A1D8A6Q8_9SPHN|nr:DNA methyltransferase [Novosphingobium resinovorum]AOR77785.1 DNA methylase [Novosphingobium resinovorum]